KQLGISATGVGGTVYGFFRSLCCYYSFHSRRVTPRPLAAPAAQAQPASAALQASSALAAHLALTRARSFRSRARRRSSSNSRTVLEARAVAAGLLPAVQAALRVPRALQSRSVSRTNPAPR